MEKNFIKKINYNFDSKLTRSLIINNIIHKKKYETYLEIGCDKDILFNSIKIKKKIGVDPVSGGNIRMTSDDFFKNNRYKFDFFLSMALINIGKLKMILLIL